MKKDLHLCLESIVDAQGLIVRASGAYEYLARKPLPDRVRLPRVVSTREAKAGGFFSFKKHKYYSFARPLTEQQRRMYGLIAMSPHDPVILAKARRLFNRRTTKAALRGDLEVKAPAGGGKVIVWEFTLEQDAPHALVVYDRNNQPVDVQKFRDVDDGLDALWELTPQKEKDALAIESIPDPKDVV